MRRATAAAAAPLRPSGTGFSLFPRQTQRRLIRTSGWQPHAPATFYVAIRENSGAMAYARFRAEGSNVYVYHDARGFLICVQCRLSDDRKLERNLERQWW